MTPPATAARAADPGSTSPSRALQAALADAEFRAHVVQRLAAAACCLMGDTRSEDCLTAMIERLQEIAQESLEAFNRIDAHFNAMLQEGARP